MFGGGLMTEICDPFAGWHAIGHLWAHCRGAEDACIEVELKGIAATTALVKVKPSFESEKTVEISEGSFKEYSENGTIWRVYCDGVNISQMLASIRICYDENATIPCSDHETQAACEAAGCYWYGGSCNSTPEGEGYELPLYGSVTVFGNTFTNTKLLCETAQAVIRPEGLASKTLVVGGAAVIFAVSAITLPGAINTAVIMGGIGVKLIEIDDACTKATIEIFNAAYTEENHKDVVQTVTEDLEEAGIDATPEKIEEVTRQAEENVKNSKEEKQRQEDVNNGVKTPEQAAVERESQIVSEAKRILIADNFSLEIPTFVMAGDVHVSGWAPKNNQDVQIMGVKKLFGFDWLASDTELAKVTSGADYKYEATLTLDEFGIIEIYSKIPKDWWDVLDKDVTTTRHTVFVLTWMMLIALVIIAALVYDKASGGKLKKMLKG
jgi:hypothetical protein